jgi:SAM-dependent methyltransferase
MSTILATGEAGSHRLRLLDLVYGPGTRAFLRRAGLRPGMRVADLGCGIGTVTCWLAEQVGLEGSVTGIDGSEQQVARACRLAEERGLANVSFLASGAEATGLPREGFDLVFCRGLLMHLPRPDEVLQEMHSLACAGGIVAVEEPEISSVFAEPPAAVLERLVYWFRALSARRGFDFRIGRTLYRRFRSTGIPDPHASLYQPICGDDTGWELTELTLAEMAPALLAERLTTPRELERWRAAFHALSTDESVFIALPRMTQVWARRSA